MPAPTATASTFLSRASPRRVWLVEDSAEGQNRQPIRLSLSGRLSVDERLSASNSPVREARHL